MSFAGKPGLRDKSKTSGETHTRYESKTSNHLDVNHEVIGEEGDAARQFEIWNMILLSLCLPASGRGRRLALVEHGGATLVCGVVRKSSVSGLPAFGIQAIYIYIYNILRL